MSCSPGFPVARFRKGEDGEEFQHYSSEQQESERLKMVCLFKPYSLGSDNPVIHV